MFPLTMAEIRALFAEYQKWLGVELCFKDFVEEIGNLPGRYTPPEKRASTRRSLQRDR